MLRIVFFILIIFSCLICGLDNHAVSATPRQEKAGQNDEESKKALKLARSLIEKGDLQEAGMEIKKALDIRGSSCGECYELTGYIYLQLGMPEEAARFFKQALDNNPSDEAQLLNMYGVALFQQDNTNLLDETARLFKRVLEISQGKVTQAYINLGMVYFRQGKQEEGLVLFKTYLQKEPKAANAEWVKSVIKNPKLWNGKPAPEFNVKSMKGEEFSLRRYKGKVILIDFWAVWCGPCLALMPEMKEIYRKFWNDNFVLLGVSLDSNRFRLEKYLVTQDIKWPQYYDGGGWNNSIGKLYEVSAIPLTVLIDTNGLIRYEGLHGGILASKIEELLAEGKGSASH